MSRERHCLELIHDILENNVTEQSFKHKLVDLPEVEDEVSTRLELMRKDTDMIIEAVTEDFMEDHDIKEIDRDIFLSRLRYNLFPAFRERIRPG